MTGKHTEEKPANKRGEKDKHEKIEGTASQALINKSGLVYQFE